MTPFDFSTLRTDHVPGEFGHAAMHNAERGALKALGTQSETAVYSGDYATLQAAIDAAHTLKRPLVIAPGNHVLTAPLVVSANSLHVSAYRATFVAGADMAALLEVKNATRCTWRGGWFQVPDGRTVANAVHVYHDGASTTRNAFYDVTIEGAYTTGLRIGAANDTAQCDHIYVENIECLGRYNAGQTGIHAGTGAFGNCLNHTFRNVMVSGHETHITVAATNAYFDGVFMDRADVDFNISTTAFSARNIRSENGKRLLVTGGPAGYGATLSFEGVMWLGQDLAADGAWISTKLAGALQLRNITLLHPAVVPTITAAPGAPLRVRIDGMTSHAAYDDLLDISANVTVKNTHYVTLAQDGNVESIT